MTLGNEPQEVTMVVREFLSRNPFLFRLFGTSSLAFTGILETDNIFVAVGIFAAWLVGLAIDIWVFFDDDDGNGVPDPVDRLASRLQVSRDDARALVSRLASLSPEVIRRLFSGLLICLLAVAGAAGCGAYSVCPEDPEYVGMKFEIANDGSGSLDIVLSQHFSLCGIPMTATGELVDVLGTPTPSGCFESPFGDFCSE